MWLVEAWNYLWDAGRTHPFEFFTLLFALAAVCISIISAWAAHVQAREARNARELNERSITEQAEALRRQSEVAEKLVGAAQRSATAAEESARLAAQGQRAWVLVDIVESQDYPLYHGRAQELEAPQEFEVSAVTTLKNSGQSLAKDLRISHLLRVGLFNASNPPEVLVFDDQAPSGSLGGGTVAQVKDTIHLPAELWTAIQMRQQTLSLLGRATYHDVFGGAHETKWLMEYNAVDRRFGWAPYFNSAT